MKTTKTISIGNKTFNLKAVAAGFIQKPKVIYKPSANLVRLKTIVAKILAKKTTAAPKPKAKAIAAPTPKAPERSNFLNRYLPTMAVNPSDLKAITQNELQALTDAELNLLKLQIEQAQRQRGYNKNRGNN